MVNEPKFTAYFEVRLSAPAPSEVTVDYATAHTAGEAVEGVDYDHTQGTLTFQEGEQVKTVMVTTSSPYTTTAKFRVELSNVQGASLADFEGECVLPLAPLRTLFFDDFAVATPGSTLETHVPVVGKRWIQPTSYNTMSWVTSDGDVASFGTPNGTEKGGMGIFAEPALPGGGSVSLQWDMSDLSAPDGDPDNQMLYIEVGNSIGTSYFYVYINMRTGDFEFGDNINYNTTYLPSYDAAHWELRWMHDGGHIGLYRNGAFLASVESGGAFDFLDTILISGMGNPHLTLDNVRVVQGGPDVLVPVYYFEGSVESPASTGNIQISGPGPLPGVEVTKSVSGNTYDRTAGVQLDLNLLPLNVTGGVRIECTYRPQIGQTSYGNNQSPSTGTTVRHQYNTIRVNFWDANYGPELEVQVPLNDMIDALYPQDAELPLGEFYLVFEVTPTEMRWQVGELDWVITALPQAANGPVHSVSVNNWASAVQQTNDQPLYEGPFCVQNLIVRDPMYVAVNPLAWYAKGMPWTNWSDRPESGTNDGSYPGDWFVGRVKDPQGKAVTWTKEWLPVNTGATAPDMQTPMGPDPANMGPDVSWAAGVGIDPSILAGETYGELRVRAFLDGEQVPGYLWITWAAGPQSYATTAWGYHV